MGFVVSVILGTLGIFFLIRGKKTMNPGLMVTGGVLILASYFLPGSCDSPKAPAPPAPKIVLVTPTPYTE